MSITTPRTEPYDLAADTTDVFDLLVKLRDEAQLTRVIDITPVIEDGRYQIIMGGAWQTLCIVIGDALIPEREGVKTVSVRSRTWGGKPYWSCPMADHEGFDWAEKVALNAFNIFWGNTFWMIKRAKMHNKGERPKLTELRRRKRNFNARKRAAL